MEVAINYVGFWRRLLALIIDAIILVPVMFIVSLAVYYPTAEFGQGNKDVAALLTYLIWFLINIFYFVGLWTWRGQTLGKMAMGVRIIKSGGGSIGIGTAIIRYISFLVSTVTLLVGHLMIAWDGKKQGLHDKIARTFVVKTS